jgi:hypothetical protein
VRDLRAHPERKSYLGESILRPSIVQIAGESTRFPPLSGRVIPIGLIADEQGSQIDIVEFIVTPLLNT